MWSGRFAQPSGTLTQLARCTAVRSARCSGRLRRVASPGRASDALLLVLATHMSGLTRHVALCHWDGRLKCLAGRVRWRCAAGSCDQTVSLERRSERRGGERRREARGDERRKERGEETGAERGQERRRLLFSCHVMSCHVVSCRVVSCRVVSCQVLSCCLAWHRFVRSRHLFSCPVWFVFSRPCLLFSCHVLSSRVMSCVVMSYSIMS